MVTALFAQNLSVTNPGTRILLLFLLILAVLLIIAGAVIAVITFSYARKQRASLGDENTAGERR
jgi:hypothetical protein